ncbi:hypothetical protein [Bilophila wadsworthia]|uniref:hypothetical protein n=1 Tax=Bilophila wadsworthia TaxID=35833 RepID=UPI0032C0F02C
MIDIKNIFRKISLVNSVELMNLCLSSLGHTIELILLWFSFFPVLPIDIKNKHFLRKKKINKHNISNNKIDIAKMFIQQMNIEYQDRKKISFEKVKILFQILTLIFTVMSATTAYIIKELKIHINPLFAFSLIISCISLLMILTYYKVSTINLLSFPTLIHGDTDEQDYLSDRLFCIEMNNARLDYLVTIYNSALRYFYIALVLLFAALYAQFNSYFSWNEFSIKFLDYIDTYSIIC